jgi:hypothetical protein
MTWSEKRNGMGHGEPEVSKPHIDDPTYFYPPACRGIGHMYIAPGSCELRVSFAATPSRYVSEVTKPRFSRNAEHHNLTCSFARVKLQSQGRRHANLHGITMGIRRAQSLIKGHRSRIWRKNLGEADAKGGLPWMIEPRLMKEKA